MSYTHTIISGRTALAGVLALAVVFPLAACAETEPDPAASPSPRGALMDSRRALFEENSAERADFRQQNAAARVELRTDARANVEAVRAASGTPAEMRTVMQENQAARREFNENERAARGELFKENAAEREAFRAQVKATIVTERDALKEKLEARRAQMAARKEEAKAALAAQAQTRVAQIVGTIADRLSAIVDRLEQIAGRIETRRAALAAEGMNTDATVQALADARAAIAETRADIAIVASVSVEVAASDAPQDRMQELRQAVDVVKKDIQAVHDALRDAVVPLNASASVKTDDANASDDADASAETNH